MQRSAVLCGANYKEFNMMNLPNDPVMLLSVVNTALRDTHQNFDEFCRNRDVEKETIVEKLKKINYEYNEELNKFI